MITPLYQANGVTDTETMSSPAGSPSEPNDPAQHAPAVPIESPWRALPVVMVGTFMAILDVFIVLVAAPAIQANLHATDAEVQLILAGYQLTYAATLITGGRLGDLFGRKRLFVVGMGVFTLASLACGAAPGPVSLIAARAVQGVGAGLMFPQVFAVIQVLLPSEGRSRAFGVLGAVIGGSTIVGQLLGGLLISADLFGTDWRPVFLINVPIGLVTMGLAARLVPESRAPHARRLDLPGVGVLTAALVLLVLPLVEGRQAGWPTWAWLSLAASAVTFCVFAAVEVRVARAGRSPLINLGLFRQRPFAVGIALVLVSYAALNSFFLVLSLVLQDGLGFSALGAGLVYTPLAVAFFAFSLLAGRLAPRYGRHVLEFGAIVTVVGFAATMAVAAGFGASLGPAALIPTLVIQGVGEGLLLTPLLNAVLARIGEDEIGMASGVLSTAQQVGGVLGVALIGVLYFGALPKAGHGGTASYAHALTVGVGFNVAAGLLATALVFALPRRSRTSTVGSSGGSPDASRP